MFAALAKKKHRQGQSIPLFHGRPGAAKYFCAGRLLLIGGEHKI
jgi:hypothetical protein